MIRLGLAIVVWIAASPAVAQEAALRASGGPHYVGVPIELQITADQFERSPEPDIDVAQPRGATLTLLNVAPQVSTSVQIINGQVNRSEQVRFVYRYRLKVTTPGNVEVGPFTVSQGNRRAQIQKVRFDVKAVPEADEQRLRLVVPGSALWVGQRIPITVEWWLTESFAERLSGRVLEVPLFDMVDRLQFEDIEDPQARTRLNVDTAAGPIEMPAQVERREWNGKNYLVVSVKRIMIPLSAGQIDVPPASIITEEAISWRSDFFGNRVPSQVRRSRAQDEPRVLRFDSPPATNRPPGFSGAVGEGFSIETSADRSVVQAGDPIRIRIDIRGAASLDGVSLPDLNVAGLDEHDFGLPSGARSGKVVDGVKRFEVDVRVLHENVREIPPIAFSWFDPTTSTYETATSRPIAVSVRAASRVSADDVIRNTPGSQEADADAKAPATKLELTLERDESPSNPALSSLSGADLAIETRIDRLQTPSMSGPGGTALIYVLHGTGLVILIAAGLYRRRQNLDPGLRALQRSLKEEHGAIAKSTTVNDLAAALRRMAGQAPVVPRAELDALLIECDNLAYARDARAAEAVDPELKSRAMTLAKAMLGGAT